MSKKLSNTIATSFQTYLSDLVWCGLHDWPQASFLPQFLPRHFEDPPPPTRNPVPTL